MSLFEDTNPRSLKDLLSEIHSRTMVLPDFQRDFVWDPGATQELIVSIANNYPAGSLLRVRDVKRAFAAREFQGAPALNGQRHTFLVLDGPATSHIALPSLLRSWRTPLLRQPEEVARWRRFRGGNLPHTGRNEMGTSPQ